MQKPDCGLFRAMFSSLRGNQVGLAVGKLTKNLRNRKSFGLGLAFHCAAHTKEIGKNSDLLISANAQCGGEYVTKKSRSCYDVSPDERNDRCMRKTTPPK
jgi:hypothetical protein